MCEKNFEDSKFKTCKQFMAWRMKLVVIAVGGHCGVVIWDFVVILTIYYLSDLKLQTKFQQYYDFKPTQSITWTCWHGITLTKEDFSIFEDIIVTQLYLKLHGSNAKKLTPQKMKIMIMPKWLRRILKLGESTVFWYNHSSSNLKILFLVFSNSHMEIRQNIAKNTLEIRYLKVFSKVC